MDKKTIDSMRKVDLVEAITSRLTMGLPLAPEYYAEADELGISIKEIEIKLGFEDAHDPEEN